MRKKRRHSYPVCVKCGAEINPDRWDDCEKYYLLNDGPYCKDCFKEWLHDWIDTNLDDVAAAIDVPVIDVM